MSHKIGVLGSRERVIAFAALGFCLHPVEDETEAREAFVRLLQSDAYAILYVTEPLGDALKGEIRRVKGCVAPAVVII